jgi:hypothetical protein
MELDRRRLLAAAGGLLSCGTAGTAAGATRNRHVGTATGATPQDSTGYGPLGSVAVPGAREAVVDGDLAYVAASDGFAVVDIADPAAPELLAERRAIETNTDQTLAGIWDVWPWADRLAVVGPAQYSPDLPSGVAVFDVSDPADPQQVSFYPTQNHIHNTHFEDGIVYLTGRDQGMSVVMVDVSGEDPAEVGRWSPLAVDERWAEVQPPLRSLHDVYVQDGVAYLPYWDAGTWMVDMSNPADPSALGRVADYTLEELAAVGREESFLVARTPRGADHFATVNGDGNLLLVGSETWSIDDSTGVVGEAGRRVGGASGVDLYDVSDPGSPERLSTIEPPASFDQTTSGWFTTSHNADFSGDRLYTSWYFGGVAVFDVSDPAEPEELARWQDPRETSFWTAQAADGFYVASSVNLSSTFGGLTESQEALYTFPDEPGSQADPPSLTDPPEDLFDSRPDNPPEVDRLGASVSRVVDVPGEDPPDGTDPDGSGGDDGTGQNGTDGTGNGGGNTGETDGDGPIGDGDGDSSGDSTGGGDTDDSGGSGDTDGSGGDDGSGPGLGIGAALGGLGGYLLARRAGGLSDSRRE